MHKLLYFTPKKNKHPKILGHALIEVMTYHEGNYYPFHLSCEVRRTQNREDFWVKLPALSLANKKTKNVNNWPAREHSDVFQTSIKSQLSFKHPDVFSKDNLTDNKKDIMGKSRMHSKFAKV